MAMRLALAQTNPTVGDFDGNVAAIRDAARAAGRDGADLVVFPELSVCGYMPRDLLEEESFLQQCDRAVAALTADAGLPPLVVGAPVRAEGAGKPLYNAALLLRGGRAETVAKRLLPTYDVFDERRYFRPGAASDPAEIAGTRIGLTICEDMWTGIAYADDPVADVVARGAAIVVNLSASPYAQGKPEQRRALLAGHARALGVPAAFCNLVGGNDQLVFDGGSFALDAAGAVCAHAAAFREDLVLTDFTGTASPPAEDVKDALVLGIRDYFGKTGFADALVGLSGGVDSALALCLAAEALGPAHVTAVAMPGPFSAPMSLADARALAETLGTRFLEIPITAQYELARRTLGAVWGERPFDVAEENLQARLRGMVLMALANKDAALVLTTSNKSEYAVGYATLYGDMCGALAPLTDLYKTQVYELAARYPMPARIRERPPSAELRPDQTDQDSLPPYDELDRILRLHIEERLTPREMVARGCDADTVRRILRMVARAEYKRQQGPPVLKVTAKAFGLGGRRFPIVERFFGGAPWA